MRRILRIYCNILCTSKLKWNAPILSLQFDWKLNYCRDFRWIQLMQTLCIHVKKIFINGNMHIRIRIESPTKQTKHKISLHHPYIICNFPTVNCYKQLLPSYFPLICHMKSSVTWHFQLRQMFWSIIQILHLCSKTGFHNPKLMIWNSFKTRWLQNVWYIIRICFVQSNFGWNLKFLPVTYQKWFWIINFWNPIRTE